MTYLLDTNVCIDYLTGRFPSVAVRLRALGPAEVCLSSIVVAELRYGADKSTRPRRNHGILDTLTGEIPCREFDARAASFYGRVRSALERRGRPIGPNDMLIAAHALSLGLVLVTDNVREFGRIRDLTVENWREAPA
jgi:tRNA(fMet)-specific endonuclease VapC